MQRTHRGIFKAKQEGFNKKAAELGSAAADDFK